MLYRTLPHTDLHVSRVCLGTMTFGDQADPDVARRLVEVCLEEGVNFLDTANVYGQGRSEEILGEILKGRRQEVILATKVRGRMGDGPDQEGLSSRAMVIAVEESLRRLQTDYLDLYYLHQPDDKVPVEETLEAAHRLHRQGKIRYLGSSNYAAWQVCELLHLARARGWPAPFVSQPMYNLLARGIEQEYLKMARHMGVSTIVYNPLAGGLLTGKHRSDSYTQGTRFDGNRMYQERYWHDANFQAVADLGRLANSCGCSLLSLSLNWILHHTPADAMILGASRVEQLQQNLAACREGPLPQEVVDGCDRIWARLRGVTPQYNR